MSPSRPAVVAKIGTSSITSSTGELSPEAIAKFCDDVAEVQRAGHDVIVVTSGAISAGLPALGFDSADRPRDAVTLQAVSSVGQHRLLQLYDVALGRHDLIGGQVLLSPLDFMVRQQYLHARSTLARLRELGVIPVINENDAVADDAVRWGDNDRIAALVAHLVQAELLVLLTDTPGLLTADPRIDASASLIEEVIEIDHELERLAGGAGTVRGSGGMASKIQAAKMAAWSGVRTVIAAADRPGVLTDAVAGKEGVGTVVLPRDSSLNARRLWIAFGSAARGRITVDEGARRALLEHPRSLLAAGVTGATGQFDADDAVEVLGPDGVAFGKGLARVNSAQCQAMAGRRSADLPEGIAPEIIHRDDLVVLV